MIIQYDTREQETELLKRRLEDMECEAERICLQYGDYSCKCTLPNGEVLNFSERVVIERKESITEICSNFGKFRDRFEREFERAKEKQCKVYLLIENATWEHIYNGKYRSKYNPKALVASILAWCARYHVVPMFCKPETSGKFIRDILYRELKEYLEHYKEGDNIGRGNSISDGG